MKWGGIWTSPNDVSNFKQMQGQGQVSLKDAIVLQLQFRKTVLGSKGPREKFQQSSKGKPYTLAELEQNLLDIIDINKENESPDADQNSNTLSYFDPEEAEGKMRATKLVLLDKLKQGRKKILVSQQSTRLPGLIENPQLLVNTKVLHKFKDAENNEINWYKGDVLSIHKLNGRLTKFNVKYEGEDEICRFPLLIDMEKGDLLIEN